MTLPFLDDSRASTYLFPIVLALARLLASRGANVDYRGLDKIGIEWKIKRFS